MPPQTVILIPKLPNDIAALILSLIPFSHHPRLKPTCKSWRHFLSSKTLITHLRSQISQSHLIAIFPSDPTLSGPFLFDPAHLAWLRLPPMPLINPHVHSLSNFSVIAIGSYLFVIGGVLFDARTFPIEMPTASRAVFRFDLVGMVWEKRRSMGTARGSFACVAVRGERDRIVVAGGGTRHGVYGAGGIRVRGVEEYDIGRDVWIEMEGLPEARAGCVGFRGQREGEVWVVGGYGEERTIGGTVPVDEYCRGAAVLEGGGWRVVEDVWGGGRVRNGKIVVLEDEEGQGVSGVFMLDEDFILRYHMTLNRWLKEAVVPRKAPPGSSVDFVTLNEELYVMTFLRGVDASGIQRSRQRNRNNVLHLQIYHPWKKSWRSLISKPPFQFPSDFRSISMCTVRI
ncbi:hypothetical protein Drorol1_Dr00022213 [Drosera rotundifolia]